MNNNFIILSLAILLSSQTKAGVISARENATTTIADARTATPVTTRLRASNNRAMNNLDYIKGARDSSIDMLIAASEKYNAGTITKDQYIEISLNVSKMASYYKKLGTSNESTDVAEGTPASATAATNANATAATTTPQAAATSGNERILIGTSNNGVDKIYTIKQNSWDAKYGYKVVIVPKNPIVKTEYELLVPYTELKDGGNEIENILNKIPDSFNVDKGVDKKPIVKADESAAGLWRMSSQTSVCVNSFETTPQPSGACKIGETAKSTAGGWANHLIADQKACIEKGFEKIKYESEFKCIPDIYQNAGGM